jgi:hypothetical protein
MTVISVFRKVITAVFVGNFESYGPVTVKEIGTFSDELFDLRCVKLEGIERELEVKDSGKVIDVLDSLKEYHAMSQEVLRFLSAIAQDLRDSIFVKEVGDGLDAYIGKAVIVEYVPGQIDLLLCLGTE